MVEVLLVDLLDGLDTIGAAGAASSSFPRGARRIRDETRGLMGDGAFLVEVVVDTISRSDDDEPIRICEVGIEMREGKRDSRRELAS